MTKIYLVENIFENDGFIEYYDKKEIAISDFKDGYEELIQRYKYKDSERYENGIAFYE